ATGVAGSFQVPATGFPAPRFSGAGALPSGVVLGPNGVLRGTPAAGTGGVYPIMIIASNGFSPDATQSFTLTVNQPPAITSANGTSFIEGAANSLSVKATGYPPPTLSETGPLPSDVTLSSSGVLAGTPATGTGGTYPITIVASNGVAPNATQNFTLRVGDFTISASPESETIPRGHDGVFTVSTQALGGLTGNVALSCSGGPPNSTCTVTSPAPLGAMATATIKLGRPKNQNGTFVVTVTGSLGSITHTVNVNLTVK